MKRKKLSGIVRGSNKGLWSLNISDYPEQWRNYYSVLTPHIRQWNLWNCGCQSQAQNEWNVASQWQKTQVLPSAVSLGGWAKLYMLHSLLSWASLLVFLSHLLNSSEFVETISYLSLSNYTSNWRNFGRPFKCL